LGINGTKLCLQFWVHGGLGGKTKPEIGRKLLGLANTPAVKEAGLIQAEETILQMPFVLDAEVLTKEYPTIDKTLAPLDAALDKLLKVHPVLDAAVKEMVEKKGSSGSSVLGVQKTTRFEQGSLTASFGWGEVNGNPQSSLEGVTAEV